MTLKQLEAFYWAVRSASFALAAEQLNLSVSSLSKRLSELETSLGQRLFDRTGHSAKLTIAGEHLLPRARDLLAAAAALRSDMADTDRQTGTYRIGTGALSALTWVPRFVATVNAAYPALEFEVRLDVGSNLEAAVLDGTLDVAIVAGRPLAGSIACEKLAEARFAWYAAEAGDVGPGLIEEALANGAAIVCLPLGSNARRILDEWLRDLDLIPTRRVTCNDWNLVASMIEEGLGIGILPVGWAKGLTDNGSLFEAESRIPLPSLPYYMHWRSDDYRQSINFFRTVAKRVTRFEPFGS